MDRKPARNLNITAVPSERKFLALVIRDVAGRSRFLSNHDSLTGLYNRRYIEESLNLMDSPENLPLCFLMGTSTA